jgi:pyruvate formate lyase activating enzyme
MKEARLYEKLDGARVRCALCAHACTLADGRAGLCRVRRNAGGTLYSLNYDKLAAAHLDPIEKKPLHHFLPGSASFSIAAMGCNFSCGFCQNHSLSVVDGEADIAGSPVTPQQLVAAACAERAASISYTYTEPTVFFELMAETAELARARGLKNVMVSNGYMSAAAFDEARAWLDAANIDIKAFSDGFYRARCGARLQPVLDTVRAMKRAGVWVEITTLVIPGLNDTDEQAEGIAAFIAGIDPEMPWHVSRFYPQHRLSDRPPTPEGDIERFLEIGARRGLTHLYAGNVAGDAWAHTRCPRCRALLIERHGYNTTLTGLEGGACRACGRVLAGVWAG